MARVKWVVFSLGEQDKAMIKAAMAKVMGDLNGCVKFTEVDASSPLYKIKITPNTGSIQT